MEFLEFEGKTTEEAIEQARRRQGSSSRRQG